MALPKNKKNPLFNLGLTDGDTNPNPEETNPPEDQNPEDKKSSEEQKPPKKPRGGGGGSKKNNDTKLAKEEKPTETTDLVPPQEEEAKVPDVINVSRYEKYQAKKKAPRPLRGIYFDPDVDEVLEALKAKRVEISRLVNDIVKKALEEDGLLKNKKEN